jgi:predicted secreted hydrolase
MRGAYVLMVAAVLAGASSKCFAPPPAPEQGGSSAADRGALQGFTQAVMPRAFTFPADHGPHPDFRHEWWYVTGNLDGPNGERFGFELTFFRVALTPLAPLPPSGATGSPVASNWRTRQIYMAHFAITDVVNKTFWSTERYARDALSLAGAQASPFNVWLEDWRIEEHGSEWRLHAVDGDRSITLDLSPQTPPIPNGENGLSRKASTLGAASYYYSIPRLSAKGEIKSGGKTFTVNGLAWLDREWGSGALGVDAQGWDWFAIQLNDGASLMFYALRNRDGSLDANSAGTWVEQSKVSRALKREDVTITPQNYWNSPRGGQYPARWKVEVPSLGLSLEVSPVLADQELATNPRYWEGAVDVAGTRAGSAVNGRGYVELVGYARERNQ